MRLYVDIHSPCGPLPIEFMPEPETYDGDFFTDEGRIVPRTTALHYLELIRKAQPTREENKFLTVLDSIYD
jgi:hypothetical protein